MGSDRTVSGSASALGVSYIDSKVTVAMVTDGLSNTMMIAESSGTTRNQKPGPYGGGGDSDGPWCLALCSTTYCYTCNTVAYLPNSPYFYNTAGTYDVASSPSTVTQAALKSKHPGGIHIVLGDGSVRFITDTILIGTLKDLADRADGNVLGDF